MKCHKDLDVWKNAMQSTADIYKMTRAFPKHEMYGLTSQMRRASVSIASNISEGAARQTQKEFIQFLYIALGSTSEVATHIELAKMLGYVDNETFLGLNELRERVSKMIYGLIRSIRDN